MSVTIFFVQYILVCLNMVHSASKIPFVAICQVLEGIQGKKTVAEKRKLLQKFVDEWRSKTFDVNDQVVDL